MKRIICVAMTIFLFIYCNIFSMASINSLETTASDGSNSIPSPQMQVLEEKAIEKYNKILKYWTPDVGSEYGNRVVFPSFYGGAYLNDDKELVILVTETDVNVYEYFSDIIDIRNVEFEKAKYSLLELKAAKERISEMISSPAYKNDVAAINGTGINMKSNSVNIYVDISNKSAEKSIDIIKKLCSEIDNLCIVEKCGKDEPSALVEPGTAIWNRSVGFWAYKDGKLGIVTAPHDTITQGQYLSINGTTFGVAHTPYYSGSVDAVFVERTNTSFIPTNYVYGWNFQLKPNTYVNMLEGSTIYSKGVISGCSFGQVLDTDYDTSYGIINAVLTAASCAVGDSGGVVAGSGTSSSRYAVGIITGKTASGQLIYVAMDNIVQTMWISVY